MFHLKPKKAKLICGGGTAGQTYITCKADPAKTTTLPSLLTTLPRLPAAQHMAACAVEGDFRKERPCHFLGALRSQEESISARYHKQTLVTCLCNAAPGNTLKTHSRQGLNFWNSLR